MWQKSENELPIERGGEREGERGREREKEIDRDGKNFFIYIAGARATRSYLTLPWQHTSLFDLTHKIHAPLWPCPSSCSCFTCITQGNISIRHNNGLFNDHFKTHRETKQFFSEGKETSHTCKSFQANITLSCSSVCKSKLTIHAASQCAGIRMAEEEGN